MPRQPGAVLNRTPTEGNLGRAKDVLAKIADDHGFAPAPTNTALILASLVTISPVRPLLSLALTSAPLASSACTTCEVAPPAEARIQRGPAEGALGIDVGSPVKQRPHNIDAAGFGGRHQRGPEALVVLGINVGSLGNQRRHNIEVAVLGGRHRRGPAKTWSPLALTSAPPSSSARTTSTRPNWEAGHQRGPEATGCPWH